MTEGKDTETPQTIEAVGHRNWERLILGENGIAGTLRIVVYIAGFAVIFGSIFYLAQ